MGFFDKLKAGLEKTKNAVFGQVNEVVKVFRKVDEELLEELEEVMICADMGATTTERIIDELRDRIKTERIKDADDVKVALAEILRDMVGEGEPLRLDTSPSVILVIGVNGVGKTTSIGKIAHHLKEEGKTVIVAAADTFRAAAIEQLAVWCDRAGVELVKQSEGSDPASVVFDGRSCSFFCVPDPNASSMTFVNSQPLLSHSALRTSDVISIGMTKLMLVPFCTKDFHW